MGEQLFSEEDDTMEMIFFEILLRLDFQSGEQGENPFTKQMYLCFEKFFVYINEQYGQIVTKTSSIASINTSSCTQWGMKSPDFDVYDNQLIGIDALWEIILGVKD